MMLWILALLFLGQFSASQVSSSSLDKISNANDYEFSVFHKDYEGSPFRNQWTSNLERIQYYMKSGKQRLKYLSLRIKKSTQVAKKEYNTESSADIPLANGVDIYGGFFISMRISNKKLLQYLIYDTGSDFLWVQCKECGKKCYRQVNPAYSMSSSPSSTKLPCSECSFPKLSNRNGCPPSQNKSQNQNQIQNQNCSFSITYGGGAQVSGIIVKDNFYLKKYDSNKYDVLQNVTFGCVTQSQHFSLPSPSPNVDGIAGFGISPLSLPAQLAKKWKQRIAFSSCLVRNFLTTQSKLIIGSDAIFNSHSKNISYTSIQRRPKTFDSLFYYIRVDKVSIQNKRLNIPSSAWNFGSLKNNGGTFLDSGTTNIYLTAAAFHPIINEIKKRVTKLEPVKDEFYTNQFSLCYYLVIQDTLDLNDDFPSITFTFQNDVNVTLKGYHYMAQISSWVVCSMLELNPDNFNVLGGYFQQDLLVVYDIERMKIGLKTMDCATENSR